MNLVLINKNNLIRYEDKNLDIRISMKKIKYKIENNIYFLFDFFVNPNVRGIGYGNYLLSNITNYADKNKIRIICDVCSFGNLSNDDLIEFYSKFGFQERDSIYLDESIVEDDKLCLIREYNK